MSTAIAPAIDSRMAESILDRLNYTLEDISLVLGDVVLESGEITHQLYYGADYSTAQIIGYIRCENGIFFTRFNNYRSPEEASLELIPAHLVAAAKKEIELERATMPDYM